MSNCKRGEGFYYINPDVFEAPTLQKGLRYTIVLLGDGEVVVRGHATIGGRGVDDDFTMHKFEGTDNVMLSLKLPLFSGHQYNNFDIIIRDDEQTLVMLPNVNYAR
jgi:hypothetical protein